MPLGIPARMRRSRVCLPTFVKRLRYDNGTKVVGVLYNYKGDDIGLINVKNGVKLTSGTVVSGKDAVAWVTGATAGAEVNESLTQHCL